MGRQYAVWWVLTGNGLVLGIKDDECLIPDTKRGIPRNALCFYSERRAAEHLSTLRFTGHWPLWTPTAQVARRHVTK